jgi:hypothetical protein
MNEPVVAGAPRPAGDWLGPDFAGKHFVQFITLDPAGRDRPDIAAAWVEYLVAAIRARDKRHLITAGLVPWSLDKPGLTSGFVPHRIAEHLDFVAVHIYPERDKVTEALETLDGFDVGKPVVIEEMFPLACPMDQFRQFVDESRPHAAGWIGFYWGKTLQEYAEAKTIAGAMMREWLQFFVEHSPHEGGR